MNTYDSLNAPGTAGYSPQYTEDLDALGLPEIAVHQQNPLYSAGGFTPVVPRPPSPSVGGETGRSRAIGWTTGLLPSRRMRQRFTGKTMVVPNAGPHPATGPVGISNRTGRLAAGVDALTTDYLPDPRTIAETFVGKRKNPLGPEYGSDGNG